MNHLNSLSTRRCQKSEEDLRLMTKRDIVRPELRIIRILYLSALGWNSNRTRALCRRKAFARPLVEDSSFAGSRLF